MPDQQPARALREDHRPRHFSLYLHRHDGHHGDHRGQRYARRTDRRRAYFWLHAGHRAIVRRACGPMDPLRRADDRHRVCPAAGNRARDRALGGELEAASRGQ